MFPCLSKVHLPKGGCEMDCTFASDNTSGVHPKVMEALNKANVARRNLTETTRGLPKPRAVSRRCSAMTSTCSLSRSVRRERAWFNRMIRSWHSVLCSDMAHTHTSESGAVEAIVGCKMTPIPSVHGKISAGPFPHI